jgi:hypothetical protein
MMRTLKSGLTIGMLVAALAMTGGCGDNDNSTNGNENGNDNGGANPTRTATPGAPVRTATPTTGAGNPTPTATPIVITQQIVTFGFTASAGVQGFTVDASYPTAKGNFKGSDDNVDCTTSSAGSFVPNDNDAGKLRLVLGNARDLTFPINIECKFEATTPITASDIGVTKQEVTQNGAPGNTDALTVNVTVS